MIQTKQNPDKSNESPHQYDFCENCHEKRRSSLSETEDKNTDFSIAISI